MLFKFQLRVFLCIVSIFILSTCDGWWLLRFLLVVLVIVSIVFGSRQHKRGFVYPSGLVGVYALCVWPQRNYFFFVVFCCAGIYGIRSHSVQVVRARCWPMSRTQHSRRWLNYKMNQHESAPNLGASMAREWSSASHSLDRKYGVAHTHQQDHRKRIRRRARYTGGNSDVTHARSFCVWGARSWRKAVGHRIYWTIK